MAVENHNGRPTVILAKTIKGYGLGEVGEGKNIAHNKKKANEDELREFRSRFRHSHRRRGCRRRSLLQAARGQR